jgi:1-pyrroline-5-carboxylate dehydrogenase
MRAGAVVGDVMSAEIDMRNETIGPFHENGDGHPPSAINEPVRVYAPGSPERRSIEQKLDAMATENIELPLIVNGRPIETGRIANVVMPHCYRQHLASAHLAGAHEVGAAIDAARAAAPSWSTMPWQDRAAIMLRAAELLAGPWRDTLNAATMLGQSKTVHQAEIDSAAELIDSSWERAIPPYYLAIVALAAYLVVQPYRRSRIV